MCYVDSDLHLESLENDVLLCEHNSLKGPFRFLRTYTLVFLLELINERRRKSAKRGLTEKAFQMYCKFGRDTRSMLEIV